MRRLERDLPLESISAVPRGVLPELRHAATSVATAEGEGPRAQDKRTAGGGVAKEALGKGKREARESTARNKKRVRVDGSFPGEKNIPAARGRKRAKKSHNSSGGDSQDSSADEDYCLCAGGNTQGGDFMVACDVCDNWYHPKCVRLTRKAAEEFSYYFCPRCLPLLSYEDLLMVDPASYEAHVVVNPLTQTVRNRVSGDFEGQTAEVAIAFREALFNREGELRAAWPPPEMIFNARTGHVGGVYAQRGYFGELAGVPQATATAWLPMQTQAQATASQRKTRKTSASRSGKKEKHHHHHHDKKEKHHHSKKSKRKHKEKKGSGTPQPAARSSGKGLSAASPAMVAAATKSNPQNSGGVRPKPPQAPQRAATVEAGVVQDSLDDSKKQTSREVG